MKILNAKELQIGDYVACYSDNDYVSLKVIGYTMNNLGEKKLLLYPISVPITHFSSYFEISYIVNSRNINTYCVDESIPYYEEVVYLTLDEINDTYDELYTIDNELQLKDPIVGYDPLDNTYLTKDDSGIPIEHLFNPAHPKERLIITPNTLMCTKVSWTSKVSEKSIVSEVSKPLSQTLKEKMESSLAKREDEYTSYARTIVEEYKKEVLEKVNTLTLYSPTTTIDLSSCPYPMAEMAPIVERLLNEDGSNFTVTVDFTSIVISFE